MISGIAHGAYEKETKKNGAAFDDVCPGVKVARKRSMSLIYRAGGDDTGDLPR